MKSGVLPSKGRPARSDTIRIFPRRRRKEMHKYILRADTSGLGRPCKRGRTVVVWTKLLPPAAPSTSLNFNCHFPQKDVYYRQNTPGRSLCSGSEGRGVDGGAS